MIYLGTINCASGARANNWTGASGGDCFSIPKYGKNLYFEPNVPTGQFQFFIQTGYSGICTASGGAYWGDGAENLSAGPFPIPRTDDFTTIAIYCGVGACKVKVYVNPA